MTGFTEDFSPMVVHFKLNTVLPGELVISAPPALALPCHVEDMISCLESNSNITLLSP